MQLLLGRAAVGMSNKRREQDGQNPRVAGGGDKKPRRGREHLYLVLDDWDKGFSIHKIDADSFDTTNDGLQTGVAGHLPEPPALRLESPAGHVPHTGMSFAALGTKIFAFMTQRCGLIYDSETAVLAIGAHAPPKMLCGFGVTVAVGEVIYALTYRFSDGQHSFEAMSWEHPTEGWSWKTLPPPPSTFRSRINSYALHPDGCTIFMTSANNGCMGIHSTPRILRGGGMASGRCHSLAKLTLMARPTRGLAFAGMATFVPAKLSPPTASTLLPIGR